MKGLLGALLLLSGIAVGVLWLDYFFVFLR